MALELYMVGVIVADMPRAVAFYGGSVSLCRIGRRSGITSRSR